MEKYRNPRATEGESICVIVLFHLEKEFEDTKEIIRMSKSKNRQHNGQKKKDERTNNDLQNTTKHL